MIIQLTEFLEAKRLDDFLEVLPKAVSQMDEAERQELLVDIIEYYYNPENFSKFKKAFDIIIGSKLNLNFNIDHWAPSFLSLVILRFPSFKLFDYFIRKGADINFVCDVLAFTSEETHEFEKEHLFFGQYVTCLDFIEYELADMFTVDFNFAYPRRLIEQNDIDGEITLDKTEYLDLVEQAEYLHRLVKADNLKDHIRSLGGKTYEELKKNKKPLK